MGESERRKCSRCGEKRAQLIILLPISEVVICIRTAMMAAKQKVPPKIVKVMAATAVLTFAALMVGYRLLF